MEYKLKVVRAWRICFRSEDLLQWALQVVVMRSLLKEIVWEVHIRHFNNVEDIYMQD